MQNPFTITFSKAPEMTYISTEKTNEILENFSYKRSSESVYKITGVRKYGVRPPNHLISAEHILYNMLTLS